MKIYYTLFFIVACISHISCQTFNDLDVDDVKKKLGEAIPEIEGIDTSKFNTSQLPSQEDVENTLNEKCKKNGAENAVDLLKEQQETVKLCIEKYVNYTVVQEELEEAKKTGSMDDVFGKYCRKWPSIYACFDNVTTTARSCMDKNEEAAFNKSLDIMEELQEFMCVKDGDRLAMFVAEGGVECIQEQKDGIERCVNNTVGSRLPDADDFSAATLPTFLFSAKDCADFDTIRECVTTELEKCKTSTPANIVDALFKFLKKHMPCGGSPRSAESSKPGSAWSLQAMSVSSVITIALLLNLYR